MVSVYVEAPQDGEKFISDAFGIPSIFMAGGITGCPDWQARMADMLDKLIIFNPRRKNFPINDPSAANKQIKWEHRYLRKVDAILYWFPKETLCPIVLYELGAWSMTEKPIFIGTHTLYRRKQDVEIQTKLARPEVEIVSTLDALADNVMSWVNDWREAKSGSQT